MLSRARGHKNVTLTNYTIIKPQNLVRCLQYIDLSVTSARVQLSAS
jgi:hypothetical protein